MCNVWDEIDGYILAFLGIALLIISSCDSIVEKLAKLAKKIKKYWSELK